MKGLHVVLLTTPFLLLSAFAPKEPSGPAQVSGVVVDSESLTPIANVEVASKKLPARTDAEGRYRINLPAGVRDLRIAAPGRPAITKVVVAPDPGGSVRQDIVVPASASDKKTLVLDRGSLLGEHGKDLDFDVAKQSNVAIADQFGNADTFLPLSTGKSRAWSPAWLDGASIAYGVDRVIHRSENRKMLGAYRFRLDRQATDQVVSGLPVSFVSKSPRSSELALANQKELYVGERRIFSLPTNEGRILSIAWAADDRIYFTVEDQIALDDRHSLGRSRIVSIAPDGSGLRPQWASDERLSFRYPLAEGSDLFFSRFALDGSGQSIWRRSLSGQAASEVASAALRPVHLDSRTRRLYYIDRYGLHLRDLGSGADLLIVTSVMSADYWRGD